MEVGGGELFLGFVAESQEVPGSRLELVEEHAFVAQRWLRVDGRDHSVVDGAAEDEALQAAAALDVAAVDREELLNAIVFLVEFVVVDRLGVEPDAEAEALFKE